ncbi:hypothetical protein BpHYR1_038774 [Brachionus plicatilis]|uniref:Uncharacterized protein n=1 Tax=Brachionus plicatilis TaxID=10195 RepID=A0A3M7SZ12_BRAPC|nr:hypothetical protein BpHYR1_038774 [Brachionus plicatilis]
MKELNKKQHLVNALEQFLPIDNFAFHNSLLCINYLKFISLKKIIYWTKNICLEKSRPSNVHGTQISIIIYFNQCVYMSFDRQWKSLNLGAICNPLFGMHSFQSASDILQISTLALIVSPVSFDLYAGVFHSTKGS